MRDSSSMVQFKSADRALMIINDVEIYGATRLQKYGFLLHKQYQKELSRISNANHELKFYDIWEPLWYGPFSRELQEDVRTCVSDNLIRETLADQGLKSYRYALTIQGRIRWREILNAHHDEISAIYEKIKNLQTMRLERLLEGIYNAYPEYTKRSKIKGRFQ